MYLALFFVFAQRSRLRKNLTPLTLISCRPNNNSNNIVVQVILTFTNIAVAVVLIRAVNLPQLKLLPTINLCCTNVIRITRRGHSIVLAVVCARSVGKVHENWIRFIQSFKLYMTAIGHDSKVEKTKSSLLLCVMGEEALEVYNSFKFETGQEHKFDNVVAKFEAYSCPKKNITSERYKFHMCTQKEDQSIDKYVTQLKVIAKSCEFADLVESLIRDRVICGIRDHNLQEALLREDTLTPDKAMSICRAKELSKSQASATSENSTTSMSIDIMESKGENCQCRRNSNCTKCGRDRQLGRCLAFGKSCYNCGELNHFARFCKSS
ncbi:uncharacterized protein LOC143448486 [Clavelina lepadiformis]|uniref:uncharacterized protein LOC143448486 n=1 Tax=Clavelina lepadiformis TaxID=159417 RepID=UPI00404278F4